MAGRIYEIFRYCPPFNIVKACRKVYKQRIGFNNKMPGLAR